jgi:hypothetical protein
MEEKYIGFLQVSEIAPDSYLGAILVTKLTSVPVEFRVTLPVKPTNIQKSLYGESMVPYIGTELCGTQLLESITHNPEVVFVSPEYMLGVRPNSAAPVIHVLEADQGHGTKTVETDLDGADQNAPAKSWQLSGSNNQPITLSTALNFTEDYEITRDLIAELALKFDLLEPFARIDRAIDVLAEQDQRFAKN